MDEKDVEASTKQTAQDFVDQCQKQLAQFEFGPKTFGPSKSLEKFEPISIICLTGAEKNLKSLDRCLDRRLMLLTKMKLGKDYKWILPSSQVNSSETLIEAAKRTLSDCFGPSLTAKFLSSAPTLVYSYRYPKRLISECGKVGARMFIFKSFVASGSITEENVNKDLVQEFCWLTRDEVKNLMLKENEEEYWKSLSSSLLEESMSEEVIKKILSRVRKNALKEDKEVEIEIKNYN